MSTSTATARSKIKPGRKSLRSESVSETALRRSSSAREETRDFEVRVPSTGDDANGSPPIVPQMNLSKSGTSLADSPNAQRTSSFERRIDESSTPPMTPQSTRSISSKYSATRDMPKNFSDEENGSNTEADAVPKVPLSLSQTLIVPSTAAPSTTTSSHRKSSGRSNPPDSKPPLNLEIKDKLAPINEAGFITTPEKSSNGKQSKRSSSSSGTGKAPTSPRNTRNSVSNSGSIIGKEKLEKVSQDVLAWVRSVLIPSPLPSTNSARGNKDMGQTSASVEKSPTATSESISSSSVDASISSESTSLKSSSGQVGSHTTGRKMSDQPNTSSAGLIAIAGLTSNIDGPLSNASTSTASQRRNSIAASHPSKFGSLDATSPVSRLHHPNLHHNSSYNSIQQHPLYGPVFSSMRLDFETWQATQQLTIDSWDNFKDGVIMIHLINYVNPSLIDINMFDMSDPLRTWEAACGIAEEKLGIANILDTKTIVESRSLDKSSELRNLVLYVSMFKTVFNERQKAPQAKCQSMVNDLKILVARKMKDLEFMNIQFEQQALRMAALTTNAELESERVYLEKRAVTMDRMIEMTRQLNSELDAQNLSLRDQNRLLNEKVSLLTKSLEQEKMEKEEALRQLDMNERIKAMAELLNEPNLDNYLEIHKDDISKAMAELTGSSS